MFWIQRAFSKTYNNIIFNISKLGPYQMSACSIIDKHTMVYSVKKRRRQGKKGKGKNFKSKITCIVWSQATGALRSLARLPGYWWYLVSWLGCQLTQVYKIFENPSRCKLMCIFCYIILCFHKKLFLKCMGICQDTRIEN